MLVDFSGSPQLSVISTNFLIITNSDMFFVYSWIITIYFQLNLERLLAKTLRVYILSTRQVQDDGNDPQVLGMDQ